MSAPLRQLETGFDKQKVRCDDSSKARQKRYRSELEGDALATHLVNLEALIQREDFETTGDIADSTPTAFKAEELLQNRNYFKGLRKPDFQRETHNWSPEMIVDFVRSFLDGDLIPALILWNSKKTGKVFVIDGCHRVSALIAWVNDDYGDGEISNSFYSYNITPLQKRLHKKTQELINAQIGSFKRLMAVNQNPELRLNDDELRRSRILFKRAPDIQEVDGPASVAEKSFLKINGNPAPIDATELDVIKARAKPNAIATRALLRAGTGYPYWGKLRRASEIEELAKSNYRLLFGQILEIDPKLSDVPRAGSPYSRQAFEMLLDIVNFFNNISPSQWRQSERPKKPKSGSPPLLEDDDADGSKTIAFLENIKRVAMLSFGGPEYQCSLGLDPAVYCYGETGKFHSVAFIACLKFSQELEQENKLFRFTEVRRKFEDFLVGHNFFINQLGHGKGSRTRPLEALLALHRTVFSSLSDGITEEKEILQRILGSPGLEQLNINPSLPSSMQTKRKRFSKSVEAAALVKQVLETRARCPICKATLAPPFRSKDHKTRVEDGGKGNLDNLEFTHPYCQSGYKEKMHSAEAKDADAI